MCPFIITFSLLLFIYPTILANLIFGGENFVVQFVALIIIVHSFNRMFLRLFQAFREMKKYALITVVTTYIEIGLASIIVLYGYGLFGALSAVLFVRTTLFILLAFRLIKRLGIHKPKISNTKKYIKFGFPLIPSALSLWVITTSDRYFIGYLIDVTSVGFYSPAYTVGMSLPIIISGVIYFALKPTLAKHYDEGNMERVKLLLKLFMKYMNLFIVPFFFGVLLFHSEIVTLLTTPEIAKEASFIAIYTSFSGIIYVFFRIFQTVLVLEKKTKIIGVAKISAALMNIVGNLFLIPIIGILGAAITTIISFSFLAILYTIISNRYIQMDFDFLIHGKIVGTSFMMFISLFGIRRIIDVYFIYLVVLGIAIYFGMIFLIKVIRKEEYEFIISTISKSK